MDQSLRISPQVEIPSGVLEWKFSRSSGPGGQSVNTSDTKVELLFDLVKSDAFPDHLHARAVSKLSDDLVDGRISVVSSRYRSQKANRDDAERKLVTLLQDAIAPPPPRRRKTRPTRSSVTKRLNTKALQGDKKKLRGRPGLNE